VKRVLIVDPDGAWPRIGDACRDRAVIEVCRDFETARRLLVAAPPVLLLTPVRLGAYNGLHLVYLARAAKCGTRCVLTGRPADRALVREAQGLGAFFEPPHRAPYAVASYLDADLPGRDRRSLEAPDRRRSFRSGRRASDRAFVC
jgi:hypothetical protein